MSPSAHDDTVSADDLIAGLSNDDTVLIDVREPHEFAAGHIPGATNHPLSEFDPSALPKGKAIVFSCQSGKRSLVAIRAAREAGRRDIAGHYAPGFGGWRAAGGDVSFD